MTNNENGVPPPDFEPGGAEAATIPKRDAFEMKAIVVEITEGDPRYASIYGGKTQAVVAFFMFLMPEVTPEDEEGDKKDVSFHRTFDIALFVGMNSLERAKEYARSFGTMPVYTVADTPTRVMLQNKFVGETSP